MSAPTIDYQSKLFSSKSKNRVWITQKKKATKHKNYLVLALGGLVLALGGLALALGGGLHFQKKVVEIKDVNTS